MGEEVRGEVEALVVRGLLHVVRGMLGVWRISGRWKRCDREQLGYHCHADYPGGCEACGRRVPVRADFR